MPAARHSELLDQVGDTLREVFPGAQGEEPQRAVSAASAEMRLLIERMCSRDEFNGRVPGDFTI
jgi:hypothetical protein